MLWPKFVWARLGINSTIHSMVSALLVAMIIADDQPTRIVKNINNFSSSSNNNNNNLTHHTLGSGIFSSNCNDEFHKECHCGSIAIPPSTSLFTRIVYPNSSIVVEEYDEDVPYGYRYLRVYYKCTEDQDVLVGNNMRECSKGNWIGLVPRCAINNLNRTKLSHIKISDFKITNKDQDVHWTNQNKQNSSAMDLDQPINVLIFYDESLQLEPRGAFQVPLENQPQDCLRWSLSTRQIWTLNLDRKTRVHYVRLKFYGNRIEDLYLNHEISIDLSLKNVSINGQSSSHHSNQSTSSNLPPDMDLLPIEIKCKETIPKESQFSAYHQKYSANYLVLDFLCEIEETERSLFEFLFHEEYEVDKLYVQCIEIRFEMLNIVHLGEQSQPTDLDFKQKIFVISLCELQLYTFRSDCGMPDVPVTAIVQRDFNFIEGDYGRGRKSYKYICIDKGQEMQGKPNIECGHYGKWKREFPKCNPSHPCNLLKHLKPKPGFLLDVKYETTTMNKYKGAVVPNGKSAKIFCIRLHDNETMAVAAQSTNASNSSLSVHLIYSETNSSSAATFPRPISARRDLNQVTCRNGKWMGLDLIHCIVYEQESINTTLAGSNGTHNQPEVNLGQVVSLPVQVIKILFALFIVLLLIIICLLIYMVIFRKQMSNQVNQFKEPVVQFGANSFSDLNNLTLLFGADPSLPTINIDYPVGCGNNAYSSADELYERITLPEMPEHSAQQQHLYHTITASNCHYSDLSLYPSSSGRKMSINFISDHFNNDLGEERYNSIYGMVEPSNDPCLPKSEMTTNNLCPPQPLMPSVDQSSMDNFHQYNTLSRSSSGYLKNNSIYEH